MIALAMPLRAMPDSIGIGPVKVDLGGTRSDGSYHWLFLSTTDSSFVPSWARWNFTGYEGKAAYPEYHDIVQTMGDLGRAPTAAVGPCGSTRSSTTATARRWR